MIGRCRVSLAVATGALAGLTWAAGFRSYMTALAGPKTEVSWYGTFVGVLLPATLVGGLYGWAEHRRRSGGELPWRRAIAAAPIIVGVVPLTKRGAIATLRTTGEGSAAGGVALGALAGGYALAGRGRKWTRVVAGVLSGAVAAGVGATGPSVGGERLALTRPAGMLTALLGTGSVLTFALAASVPFRGRDQREFSAS
ncbi:hypothetical protein [Agromyces sp. NPDC049794]|uniref:hypothetical protein n=1 Tax=unclassified Agromyces TaxID=2639701 RepID=UPI0033DCCE68